jgi:flagellar biosynthesis protein FlhB
MSEDAEQNKSEDATPFKLTKAREKGMLARGMDLGFFTAVTAFLIYMWIFGDSIGLGVQEAVRGALVTAPTALDSRNALLLLTGGVLAKAAKPILFMGAAMFGGVLLFELVQTRGFVFSTHPLKPDFNRLNPAQGLKKLFTVRLLIETAKNIVKLLVYAGLTWMVIQQSLGEAAPGIHDAATLAAAMWGMALRLVACFAVAALAFAALDQIITRRDFAKKMRMSRRDIRRESRDREGDPRLKSKRKQLHGEFIKASESLRGVRGADVMITNPTHYAVALRYDRSAMNAPMIVARGTNQFALRLKRMAFLHGVTIVQHPVLARALYAHGQLNAEIPDSFYQSVADVYLALRGQPNTEVA